MLVSTGFSYHQACRSVGFPALYYDCWVKLLIKVDDVNASDDYVSPNMNGMACKIHPGQKSILAGIGPQLNRFTFQMRGQGLHLKNWIVR